MNKILNPKWQKEKFIEIVEFTSEEESHSKKFEGMISKDLENIEEIIKYIPYIIVDKGKGETTREQLHVEEVIEDIQNCKVPGEENVVLSSDNERKKTVNPEYENQQRVEET